MPSIIISGSMPLPSRASLAFRRARAAAAASSVKMVLALTAGFSLTIGLRMLGTTLGCSPNRYSCMDDTLAGGNVPPLPGFSAPKPVALKSSPRSLASAMALSISHCDANRSPFCDGYGVVARPDAVLNTSPPLIGPPSTARPSWVMARGSVLGADGCSATGAACFAAPSQPSCHRSFDWPVRNAGATRSLPSACAWAPSERIPS